MKSSRPGKPTKRRRFVTLVDTSAWIEQLRRGGTANVRERVEALLSAGEAAWCPLVRLELWNGARAGTETAALREMENAIVDLPIDEEVWSMATEKARLCRNHGITIPVTDLIIAACALRHGVPLEHADRHFDQIP